uniref:Receptor protein-tyrosine kinase n=1 Tax=Steinernema glaseri TaxID=37863 RepID=A0A1I7XZ28_9BILA
MTGHHATLFHFLQQKTFVHSERKRSRIVAHSAHHSLLVESGSNAVAAAGRRVPIADDDDEEWTEDVLSDGVLLEMPPKPYDDLFIEPANDDDVVYGDYNDTMEDGASTGKRPYIRLNAQLSDMTKHTGGEVKFKCEAAGAPLPLTFKWEKNHAPVEKDSRIRIRNRDYSSKLIITDLDVLDSGYYQCVVSNGAGSVNTTSVLRVSHSPEGSAKSKSHKGGKRTKAEEHDDEYIDDFSMDRGRLPSEEDDMFRVSDNAAGPGYVPLGGPHSAGDRWLDRHQLRIGDCVLYRGEACREFLNGKYVMITSDNREEMYDIDRNLRAAMMVIKGLPNISKECKTFSHSVACFHKYKVCDKSPSQVPGTSGVISICRKDCDLLTEKVCPNEMALASQHDLVGDDAKALLPKCDSLSPNALKCLPILTPALPPPPPINIPVDKDDATMQQTEQWCYVDNGSSYEGTAQNTKSGKKCSYWSQSAKASGLRMSYPELKTSKNYCRNPGGTRSNPWCYAGPYDLAEDCDIPKCPPSYYPQLKDTVSDSSDSSSGKVAGPSEEGPFLDKMSNFITSMSSQWHIAAMCGVATLAIVLLLFLICCMCGCRKKRKAPSSVMSSVQKNGAPLASCNGSSLVNSAANSAYYRKINGTATPANQSNTAFELSSLLPPSQNGNPIYGMPVGPYGDSSRPSTEPPLEPYHIPQIPYEALHFTELCEQGQFGSLVSASWRGGTYGGQEVQVAVKSLRENATLEEVRNFEEEVKTVAAFEHSNVVRLLGVTYRDGHFLCAVYEYMVHGDLHEFLRLRSPQHDQKHDQKQDQERLCSDFEDFLRIAIQIAAGMEYLASMNFVHRDLATRNCLVGEKRVIKISDFGPLRSDYQSDYCAIDQRGLLPIRWMAPEAIERNRFSQASDIWSFGVTLWEIYSYGKRPYGNNTNEYVMDMLNMRNLLEPPYGCPTNIYSLMVECWHEHPERRPSFAELHQRLASWSFTSPAQSMLSHQNRASSTHSGGSSGVRGSRQTSSSTQSGSGPRNINNFGVPSPAPGQGTATKLTLTNNGNSIVHSTPLSQNYVSSNGNNPLVSRGAIGSKSDASPLMRRHMTPNNYDYSDGDDESE